MCLSNTELSTVGGFDWTRCPHLSFESPSEPLGCLSRSVERGVTRVTGDQGSYTRGRGHLDPSSGRVESSGQTSVAPPSRRSASRQGDSSRTRR